MTIDQLIIKEKADKFKDEFNKLNQKFVEYEKTIERLIKEKGDIYERLLDLKGRYASLIELIPQEVVKTQEKKEEKKEEVKAEEKKEESKK